jgi:hypothetical protein
MALRQSYEQRELYEIRWINGTDNPADAFTKKAPNKSLKTLIETNTAHIRIDGWVDRTDIIQFSENPLHTESKLGTSPREPKNIRIKQEISEGSNS